MWIRIRLDSEKHAASVGDARVVKDRRCDRGYKRRTKRMGSHAERRAAGVDSTSMEAVMDIKKIVRRQNPSPVLAMATIKEALAAFERGEVNVLTALSAIARASEPYADLNLDRRGAA